jgi:Fe-S-cluster-containing hydrogenase component 2/CRP-like cAMP-binding protein
VISHTGRGHDARITFDLDDPMSKSSCVSCGECAISCPTGALSFRGTVYQDRDAWRDHQPKPHTVKADELHKLPLFASIPFAFLKWNEGAVGRLKLEPGHLLCERGDFGATAFLLEEGELDIDRGGGLPTISATSPGMLIGEMGCMNNGPRNATVRARSRGAVLVIRRNMLHMLRRNKTARDMLDHAYSTRALENWMHGGTLFDGFTPELSRKQLEILRTIPAEVRFVRVDPRETFIEQGERADCIYVLLSGRVEISEATSSGVAQVRAHLSPGQCFGEIGVISTISRRVAAAVPESARGKRIATCRSLDHVELIRISDQAIFTLIERDEQLLPELEERCLAMIARNRADSNLVKGDLRNEFSRQGLYQGQNLLLIDLEKCTRCLECVKACSDTHQGHSRLMFDGERFDKYLVPQACRSCHDPECLNGCPVDAIHRRPPAQSRSGHPTLAVFIEDHCIGCGLCAQNCPFHSIQMHDLPHARGAASRPIGAATRVARNCDLCESLDGVPRCVYSCPHGAADRPARDHITDRLLLNIL